MSVTKEDSTFLLRPVLEMASNIVKASIVMSALREHGYGGLISSGLDTKPIPLVYSM